MNIFIVVPVFNEGMRVVETVRGILRVVGEVVVVIDDGSNDGSYKMLIDNFKRNERVVILRHIMNLGKGAAMKTGVEIAWKLRADGVVFIDGDGQHDPKRLSAFIRLLNKKDLVFGYRDLGDKMPIVRRLGNIFAKRVMRLLFGINRKDLLCGFLGFKKSVYPKIVWGSSRYGVETEMAAKVGKNKLLFAEVKIDTIYVDKYKGVSMLDALKILIQLPFWYFS